MAYRDHENGGTDDGGVTIQWDVVQVWLMRILSVAWLAKGILNWALLLGGLDGAAAFETLTFQEQSIVVYFSVIDLVAGVGLWLASSWGGVIWLLAAMSHIAVTFLWPHIFVNSTIIAGVTLALALLYLTISWLATRSTR